MILKPNRTTPATPYEQPAVIDWSLTVRRREAGILFVTSPRFSQRRWFFRQVIKQAGNEEELGPYELSPRFADKLVDQIAAIDVEALDTVYDYDSASGRHETAEEARVAMAIAVEGMTRQVRPDLVAVGNY